MVARTPPLPSTPEILKGLKFKQRSCHRYHTHFGRNFNPWCGTRRSRCICEI